MTGEWTGSFGRSGLAPAVFEVAPAARPAVRGWLAAEAVPFAWSRDPGCPAVDGWSVLDGGVVAVAHGPHPDPGAVPSGMYVVGFGPFRLLTAAIGLARPVRPVPGEPLYDLDDLRAAHQDRRPGCPVAREQAELLASCVDLRTLRWVAQAWASTAPAGTRVAPDPAPPAAPPAAPDFAQDFAPPAPTSGAEPDSRPVPARDTTRVTARDAALDTARDAALDKARDAALDKARDTARTSVRETLAG